MKKIVLGAVALLLMAGVSYGQSLTHGAAGDFLFNRFDHVLFEKSDMTWSSAFSLTAPLGSDTPTVFSLYGTVGYFFTDFMEAEAGALWRGAEDFNEGRLLLGVNYYFIEWREDVFPYIGVSASLGIGDSADAEGTHVQGKIGVRQYFSRHSGIRYWGEVDGNVEDLGKLTGSLYIGFFAHPN